MIFTRSDLVKISAEADEFAEHAARLYLLAAKVSAEIKRREAAELRKKPAKTSGRPKPTKRAKPVKGKRRKGRK